MLSCSKPLPTRSTNNHFSSPASQGHAVENTPRSSAQLSPIINLTHEFALAVQTNSYGEIRRIFHQNSSLDQNVNIEHVDISEEPQLLEQVLQPSRECVQDAVSLIRSSPITSLVASYFEQSEHTSHLYFILYQSVRRARHLYSRIHNFLDDLPLEFESVSYSLSQSQCDSAYDIFLQFDCFENPFLSPDTQSINGMRQGFSDLRQQVDNHLRKSQSRVHRKRYCSTGTALCLIAAGVGVAISAVAIATHGLVALVGSPVCLAVFPSNMPGKEKIHLAQLDAATRNTYLLYNDLETIDRLVRHLHNDVENDKFHVRMGLERDMDKYLVQEILKQLQRNRPSFVQRLDSLKDHLFICLDGINGSRKRLLEQIHLHQNHG